MDPLSVSASVIAILEVTGKLITTCYKYQRAARNAPGDIDRITKQLINLRSVLESILTIENGEDLNGPELLPILGQLDKPDGPLAQVLVELENLDKILKPPDGWKAKRQALLWPLKEAEVAKTLDHLERTKATLHLALTADQTARMLAIQNGVMAVKETAASMKDNVIAMKENITNLHESVTTSFTMLVQSNELTRQDELRHKIFRWLSAPDFFSNHNSARKKWQPKTGMWFIGGQYFTQWKNALHQFLWLHGIPGCGKTILCSTIIEEVMHHCTLDPSLAIAYFYFDFSDEQKQCNDSLIRSLITQFASQCSCLPDPLVTLYSHNQNPERQPTTVALRSILQDILGGFGHAYIIIDALDECTERDELLGFMEEMVHWRLGKLHILVTSRWERDIVDCLESQVSCQINIQSPLVDQDIQTHICDRLENDHKLKKWSIKVKDEIEAALMAGAHGMFRWVVCQLDALRMCMKADGLKKALKSLPKTLDETYERILLGIDEEYRGDAFKVFQWLAFSVRPVTLEEVAEVLAIDFNHGPQFMLDKRLQDPQDILTICSSMVTISSSSLKSDDPGDVNIKYDTKKNGILMKSGELRLAHFSVKEYLVSERLQNSPASWCCVNKKSANFFLSKTCLAYLLQFKTHGCLALNWRKDFPLACYAAQFWFLHAQSDGYGPSHDVQNLIMNLLQPQSPQYINWIQIYDPDDPWCLQIRNESPNITAPPLYYAALINLEETVLQLQAMKVDVNAQGGRFGTALQAASSEGHEAIVQLLLDMGADINAQGGQFGNALQVASFEGHSATVQLLLDKGADIHAQGGWFGNALQAASSGGHEAIVRLLLDRQADVNAQGGEFGNALQVAVSGGHDVIVQLLLDRGADINAQGGWFGNVLYAALLGGNVAIMRVLLDKGADINAQGGWFGNVLQAASSGGHVGIVQLLLDRGADINAQGGRFGSALQVASLGGHVDVVQLLLDKGVEVNAQSGQFGSALQAASSGGHEAIVQLLLDHGAEINTQGGRFGSALEAASAGGHDAIVKLLLDKGADISPG